MCKRCWASYTFIKESKGRVIVSKTHLLVVERFYFEILYSSLNIFLYLEKKSNIYAKANFASN